MAIQVEDVFSVPNVILGTVRESGYRLSDGDKRVWTMSSRVLLWHDGVKYCSARGSKLQTLDDAVLFRHETRRAYDSDLRQLTGTLVAIGNDGEAGLHAYVWEPSADELVALAERDDMQKGCYVDVAKNSAIGRRVLKTDRTFIVPSSFDPELSVKTDEQGNSPYSKDEKVLALMPKNARLNAENIARSGYKTGKIRLHHDRRAWVDGQLRIRPFGLGGTCGCVFSDSDSVYAHDGFYFSERTDGSRARGLVHVGVKLPTKNEGRRI